MAAPGDRRGQSPRAFSFVAAFPRVRGERVIAVARLALAATSLLAVWLDPLNPSRHVALTYSLLIAYVAYSGALALATWRMRHVGDRFGLATHALDLASYAVFLYLTSPSGPLFAYFVFSVLCGTVRWQSRGGLAAGLAALGTFLGVSLFGARAPSGSEFDLDRFLIRIVYLAIVAGVLSYLSAYEQRARDDIARLIVPPQSGLPDERAFLGKLLADAASVLAVSRLVLTWERREEPWLEIAEWTSGGLARTRQAPGAFDPLVAAALAQTDFLAPAVSSTAPILTSRSGDLSRWEGVPVHPDFRASLGTGPILGLGLGGETFQGHLFCPVGPGHTTDAFLLGQVLARQISARLDHFHLLAEVRDTTALEERVRLARDLHDGLLQSLTGLAFQLEAVRAHLARAPADADTYLADVQRVLREEQARVRTTVEDLRGEPPPRTAALPLSDALAQVAGRLQSEWGVTVTIDVEQPEPPTGDSLRRDVDYLIREAVANAVRHGAARSVRVALSGHLDGLHLAVADDGRGFPFSGRHDQAALARQGWGPRALRDRVTARGGTLVVESDASGARIEMVLPHPPV
jgi:signal transduction histidine kinase